MLSDGRNGAGSESMAAAVSIIIMVSWVGVLRSSVLCRVGNRVLGKVRFRCCVRGAAHYIGGGSASPLENASKAPGRRPGRKNRAKSKEAESRDPFLCLLLNN